MRSIRSNSFLISKGAPKKGAEPLRFHDVAKSMVHYVELTTNLITQQRIKIAFMKKLRAVAVGELLYSEVLSD